MKRCDKRVKNLSKEFPVPDSYHERVDKLLTELQKEEYSVQPPGKKTGFRVACVAGLLCILLIGSFVFSGREVAKAGFFDTFRQNVLGFLGIEQEEKENAGVRSRKEDVVGRSDLMIELDEIVMDEQNIYAVVRITAPTDVEFGEDVTFDYYGFCEGTNYTASKAVPGVRDCTLLETLSQKNAASYVVSISTDEQLKEGKTMTVFFKDLICRETKEEPQVLVEGMWSLSFTAAYTTTEKITVKGTEDTFYSMLGKKILIKKVKLLPLGITIVSDVSEIPSDTLHVSDTRITVKIKMINGTEILVDSPKVEEKGLVSGSSVSEYERKGRVYHKYTGQFEKAVDISKVLGVYVEGCYVPVKAE